MLFKMVQKNQKPELGGRIEKEKQVKELVEKIRNSKTLIIVSIKGLPSRQFQDIKKSIRSDVLVKVAKKNIILRVIKALEKKSALDLEKYINENCALAISNSEGFELASTLSQRKTSIAAKAGQTAPDDIEVKKGQTNLSPGPAISELGSLGIQISVEEGKISIKAKKVIVKKGERISESVASILQKLDIHPFKIGLEPIVIYDIQSEKIYSGIKIDSEKTLGELRTAASKALGFAQKIAYYCKETISYFLARANSHARALSKPKPKEESGGN